MFKVDFDTQKDALRALKATVAEHADRVQGREPRRRGRSATPTRLRSPRCSKRRSSGQTMTDRRARSRLPRRRACRCFRLACCRCCRSFSAPPRASTGSGRIALAARARAVLHRRSAYSSPRSALPWASIRDVFRTVSAVLLIGVGLVLLVPRLQAQFALAAAPVSNWAGGYAGNFAHGRSWPASSGSGCCSARCGARASARRSAPPRCSPPRAKIFGAGRAHHARVRRRRGAAAACCSASCRARR